MQPPHEKGFTLLQASGVPGYSGPTGNNSGQTQRQSNFGPVKQAVAGVRAVPYGGPVGGGQHPRQSNFGPPKDQLGQPPQASPRTQQMLAQQQGSGYHGPTMGAGQFTGGQPAQPVTFQPLLNADGSPMFINGQQVYVAAPAPAAGAQ